MTAILKQSILFLIFAFSSVIIIQCSKKVVIEPVNWDILESQLNAFPVKISHINTAEIKVIYVFDPLCSSCVHYLRELSSLQEALEYYLEGIQFHLIGVGSSDKEVLDVCEYEFNNKSNCFFIDDNTLEPDQEIFIREYKYKDMLVHKGQILSSGIPNIEYRSDIIHKVKTWANRQ